MSFPNDTVYKTIAVLQQSHIVNIYFLAPSLDIWKEVIVKFKYMHSCKCHEIREKWD